MSEDVFPSSPAVEKSPTIVTLFERCVSAAPDAAALMTPERTVSYRELDDAASRIAQCIQSETDNPQGPVALMTEDSFACLAGMLGAAKAGRIFIPLDTTFPESYLAETIAASGSTLIFTDAASDELAHRVKGGAGLLSIESLNARAAQREALHNASGSPAYILYTSGSTGNPKGVVLSHEFLIRYVNVWSKTFGIGPGDRMSLLFSCNWGTGMHNTFVALLSGACVCPLEVRSKGVAALSQWLSDFRITILVTTSSLFRTWIATLPEGCAFPRLRLIRNVSEPLYSEDILRAAPHFSPDCRIVHSLGTTETGTVAIHALSFDKTPPEDGILPVGRAAAGIEIRLEDESGALAPSGQTGEIVLLGRCLALGYWNDPALTNAVFKPDRADPSLRSYRSGDFGRWRKDGLLEYLGRKDRKVKVRGFTIELYEIERALLRLPEVRETVVLLHKDDSGDGRLIAYVVGPQSGVPESLQSISERLGDHLPAHMIPSNIIVLSAMPLTERGKIDRSALPVPPDRRQQRAAYRTPSNKLETSLASIWQEILKVENVGVDDDFYELGGSSLQAFLIFARIANVLGHDLPPTTMLQAPTVARQAELLHNARPPADEKLVPFRRSGPGLPLFVVHGAFGDIMFTREIVRDLRSDRPVYGLQPAPLDGAHRLPRTMETIAAGYLSEIRKVQPKGPYFLAGYSFGGMAALEMAQQLTRAGEPVAFVGLIDTIYGGRYQVAGESTTTRAHRHWKQIRSRHAPAYVAKRLAKTLAYFAKNVRENLGELRNELRYRLGWSIPYEKRAPFYRLIFFRATQRYRPKPYQGALTMFSAQGMTEWHRKRWNNIAGGGLRIHEIPADHLDLVWPPHSRLLAECFDACLESAAV